MLTRKDFGICYDLLRDSDLEIPVLGVCLGHQGLASAFGGKVMKSEFPVHGQTFPIHHNQEGLFENIQNTFLAVRYHSLIVDQVPDSLIVTAWTIEKDGSKSVMGLEHVSKPFFGVQFHPEVPFFILYSFSNHDFF
jgi:anthranilate synthase/aminodeoxychorismate synthase-like glutamine amidotransferase